MSHRLPLTQSYNLDFQYDLGGGWVVDAGYVGSHSIHLLSQGSPTNVAHLVDCGPASLLACNAELPVIAQPQDLAMFKNPNFPGGNPDPVQRSGERDATFTVNTTQNAPARVSYLGYTAAGSLTTTNTAGRCEVTTACKCKSVTISRTGCSCRPRIPGARI